MKLDKFIDIMIYLLIIFGTMVFYMAKHSPNNKIFSHIGFICLGSFYLLNVKSAIGNKRYFFAALSTFAGVFSVYVGIYKIIYLYILN